MHFIGISVIVCLLALAKSQSLPHDKIVVCATLPQFYRIDKLQNEFMPEKADFSLCTHVFLMDYYHDAVSLDLEDELRIKDIEKITSVRKKYPQLKILLCTDIVAFFEEYLDFASNENTVNEFFKDWVDDIKSQDLNGIDLNWGDTEESLLDIRVLMKKKNQIFNLLTELKKAFDKENLLLTMSFSADSMFFENDFHISGYAQHFKFIHFMPTIMDFSRNVFERNEMNYAISELSQSTTHKKIDKLIKSGIPESKLILGINFRGVFANTTIYGNANEATTGAYIPYNVLCHALLNGWEESYDVDTGLTMLMSDVVAEQKKLIFLYQPSRTIANDIKFVRSRGLAGILAFSIEMDDFQAKCPFNVLFTFNDYEKDETARIPKRDSNQFPLLRSINAAFFATIPQDEVETKHEIGNGEGIMTSKPEIVGENNKNAGTASDRFQYHSFYPIFIPFGIVLLLNY